MPAGVIAHNLFHRVGDARTRFDVLRDVFRRTFEIYLADPATFILWYQHGHGVSVAADATVTEFVQEVESLLIEMLDRTITVGDRFDEPTRRLVAASMLGYATLAKSAPGIGALPARAVNRIPDRRASRETDRSSGPTADPASPRPTPP